jgi:hypothetical protein
VAKIPDGGGGGLPSIGSLTSDNGTSIDWGNVLAVVAGVLSVEYFSGVADVVATAFQTWAIGPISAAGYWLENVVGELVDAPARVSGAAWASATAFVDGTGFAGLLVAVAIVGVTLVGIVVVAEVVG